MDAIEMRLRKIGKKAFVDYLYVELKKNIDVSIEEITHKHIEFGRYKLSSQQTRLSNARTIFREGWSKAALRIIAGSSKVDRNTRKRAMQLLNVGVPYSEKA